MKKDITSTILGLACACSSLFFFSCSSDEETLPGTEGKGAVQLSLTADMGFVTNTKAAVNEDTYVKDHLNDYTVKILDGEGQTVKGCEWKYSALPTELIELKNGSYKVVASYGETYNEDASTRDGIYMYGEKAFDVNSDQVAKQTVSCTPACGKLVVKFGEKMAEYFSDYAVHFSTKAVSKNGAIILSKDDADPLYVKLDQAGESVTATFQITAKDGKKAELKALTKTMKWGTMWTITVNPKVSTTTGKVGITINFNDGTTDKPIDIEIPSDWL